MHKYKYSGPVREFDTYISDHWEGETVAESERKAKSNLAYQFKRDNHRLPSVKITLPDKLKIID